MTSRIALELFGAVRGETDDRTAAEAPPDGSEAEAGVPAAPAEPEIDLEAERLACLARIADTVEVVASEQAGLRARCIGDAAAALGAAAETLLPRLARAGFAALVTETAQTIVRRGQWPELRLAVAPDQAAAIAAALGEIGPVTEVKVTADPVLGDGEAQLSWRDGGAEIDVEAIAEAALERFRTQLDGCLQQGQQQGQQQGM
jgi:hypothetical protein